MDIIKLTVGQLQSNTYILRLDHQVLIIDPGAEYYKIKKHIKDDDTIIAVLLTHGHADHIGAVNDILSDFNCDVYIDSDELELVSDPTMSFYNGKINTELKCFKSTFELGVFKIGIHKTPGHTIGSVLIEIGEDLFTGDTLFNLTVGRMDLPSGSELDMRNSLKYIRTFHKDFKIHPGHGSDSTLYYQFENNPYFN